MNLTTQCPQCGTTFQAALEQLQLRKGFIRCINCAHIFDGYEAVVPSSSDAPEFIVSSDRSRPPTVSTSPEFRVSDSTPPSSGPVFDLGKPPADPEYPDELPVSVVHTRARPDGVPPPSVYVEPRAESSGRSRPSRPEFSGSGRSGLAGAASLAWQLAILIATVALLGQLVYVYRVQIASQFPGLRPALEAACSHLQCSVPYSRRIELITITGAVLNGQASSGDKEGKPMELQLTLRNDYDKPQEWPTLELDLNDFSGTLQVRKNIPPQSYLTPELLQGPFGAQTQYAMRLPIVVLNDLSINGFQIRKYFP